jgi:hypothetical protein
MYIRQDIKTTPGNGNYQETFKPSHVQKYTRLKICNTLALFSLLYGCETWAKREEDKYRITSVETKFIRRMTKTQSKTNEDILSKVKISPIVKKIQNYGSKWVQHVRLMDRDKQTDCHAYL